MRKKRMPSCNGTDREQLVRGQYPTRKRADFREVFHDEKSDQTTKKGKQMTEELKEGSTGAPFHGVTDWHAIDWKSANNNVRRLQTRIEKRNEGKEMG
jgi:hypothetical protein